MITWNSVKRNYKAAIRGVFQFTRSITSETPSVPLRDDGEGLISAIEANNLGRLSFVRQNLLGFQSSIRIDGILSEVSSGSAVSEIGPSGVLSRVSNRPTGLLSKIE